MFNELIDLTLEPKQRKVKQTTGQICKQYTLQQLLQSVDQDSGY